MSLRTKRSTSALVLATCTMFLSTNAAFAQFTFDAGVTFPTGQRPEGIASGDFNNDGILDLGVVTDPQNTNGLERLEILNGVGDGTFTPGAIIVLPNSSSPSELAAGDFDGDGDDDFLVVLEDFNQVMTITNNGGTFTQGATAPVGANARGLHLGDLDNDGDLDATVANRDSNTATVLTNAGNGTFTSATLAAGTEPRASTFSDIDGDGDLDLAVSNHDSRSISLFTNNAGTFTLSGTLAIPSPFRPEGITSADLNGDGLDDLAVATEGNGVNVARVYLNQGGSFGAAAQYNTSGIDTSTIIAADLDCDENIDLLTLNDSSANVSLLNNLGTGTFSPGQTLAVASEPSQATVADFDGDGDLDIAVSNKFANSVSVLMNQTCELVTEAPLSDVSVTFGTLLSGNLSSITDSDDVTLNTASAFGFLSSEPNVTKIRVGATAAGTPTLLNVLVEARANNPTAQSSIRIRNWSNNGLDLLGTATLQNVDTTQQFSGIDATNYVRSSDSRVEIEIRHVAIFVFSSAGILSNIDHVEVTTE